MSCYFYVIKSSKDGSLYKGITENIQRRIKQHNAGKNLSTKYNKPYILVYVEELDSRREARKREKYFKSGIGRESLKEIVFNN